MNTTRSLKIEMSFFFQESLFAYFFCWRFVCFFSSNKKRSEQYDYQKICTRTHFDGKEEFGFFKRTKKRRSSQSVVGFIG